MNRFESFPPPLSPEAQKKATEFAKAGRIWEAIESGEEPTELESPEEAKGIIEALTYLKEVQIRPYTPEQHDAQYKKVDEYIEKLKEVAK